ncbi:3-phosphoinositide-dependent protein kinase 1 isoform X2 [Echeneis naucrates]|uniref:3-phosphoinositide-dependent protein kinase 1 isoform X2 n=1 Tax=Echeneis naucrates TaxID=173247 RepID=UPI001113F1B7|nr:3-phosphoinositide-dependent protein kinase 1 isoform X2 [Echeneis naucrates]
MARATSQLYDVVPIQPSVVICSCSHPSMVRNHPDSCSPLAIPGASSSHCPSMEGSASEARAVGGSASNQVSDLRTTPAAQTPQPRKKKPEDFRFGKILGEGSFSTVVLAREQVTGKEYATRANSFVGTAQYVSPELLTEKSACKSSDLWALGCIIYQLVAGLPPFRAGNEYLIFQKIIKLEYEFPEKFFPKAKDLVKQLLSLDPSKRIGCEEMGGYSPLKQHPFFDTISWSDLYLQTPPKLTPYLPAMSEDDEDCYGNYDDLLSQFSNMQVGQSSSSHSLSPHESTPPQRSSSNIEQYIHDLDNNSFELDLQFTEEEKQLLLDKQTTGNPWHQFVENNLILKMGPVDKRKGLFARRRQLLLTEGPHLYYVDPVNKVLKGEIPWSLELRPEAKNFKTFFVHTPNRTYYLMDPSGNADRWCKKIQEVWRKIYQRHQNPGL